MNHRGLIAGAMGAFYFLETAVIGTVVSLIVALISKTKRLQLAMASQIITFLLGRES